METFKFILGIAGGAGMLFMITYKRNLNFLTAKYWGYVFFWFIFLLMIRISCR